MEILEDPVFKSNYQKNKLRVKLWESDFTELHGRKPNKNDIKEADVKIKEAYKMYWKLKTRALEETLMDITFSDEVQDNVPNNNFTKTTVEETKEENKSTIDDIAKDAENIDPRPANSASDVSNSNLNETETKNVKGVWGGHLSKTNEQLPKRKQNLLVGKSTSFQLSQNKFTSSSFVKRNPRKSLSMSKIKTKSETSINVAANSIKPTGSDNNDVRGQSKETKPIFGEAVKVTYVEDKPVTQSVNTIQSLIDGHTVNRNLNAGWLDRCSKQSNLGYPKVNPERLSVTSDSGMDSMESSIYSPKESVSAAQPAKSLQVSDEEDFICNSDSEEERRNKRIRNFKKRLSGEDIHASKRPCLDSNTSALNVQLPSNVLEKQNDFNNLGKSNINHSNVISKLETSKVANDDVNTATNLTRTNAKYSEPTKETIEKEPNTDDDAEDSEPKTRKPVRRRTVNRKAKPSVDDPNVEGEEKDLAKKKERPATRQRSKKTAEEKSTVKREKRTTVKAKRPSRRKKSMETEEEEKDEEPEAVKEKEVEIYGVETLKAVPRFAIGKSSTGNLIEKFRQSVSRTADDADAPLLPAKSKGGLTDLEKLEKKVADGKVNENFVRINLKKKVFVRGKKHFNFSKYKKNQWKQRKKELNSSEGSLDVADFLEKKGAITSCFKCGEIGHFARYCPNQKGSDLVPLDEVDEISQFPTLEEAQAMASQNAVAAHGHRIGRLPEKPSYSSEIPQESEEGATEDQTEDLWEPIEDEELLCGHQIPEDLVSKLLPPEIDVVRPLYEAKADQLLIETPSEVFEVLRMFGHQSFRAGQEKAVMRILSGQSTLVTLSTGSGKSLCYQLPAYLYSKHSHCITLVISPLVSLMDDQVTGVPAFLSAACLHTGQTPKVRDNVMEMVKNGKVNILLVSPEAVVAGEKSTGFGALLRQLPPIAFACIDEAHCISQWSHNFRPSYLMVCRVLKEKLGVKTVLALTATATKTTAESIVRHLNVHDGMNGVISDVPMPRNLLLTVSKDDQRDQALVTLLQSERFQECDSVIVYCTRREECVRIAGLLRIHLQDVNNPERTTVKLSSIAEAYHAGLSASRRKTVQKAFMNGSTRIIVATVAFGMGLNKADIRSVIHYNMPGTFEGYVQEVGRAGRDGLRAHCHLFLSPKEDSDKWELRRHIYANGVDRHAIRRLLEKVFVPCSCGKLRGNGRCPGHEVAIPVAETVAALDITEETISTLLCYLELHPKRFITVLSSVYVRARVSSYGGPQALKLAAQSSPPLAMAIALDLQKGVSHDNSNLIEFPVVDVASAIGWDSGVVKSHLKNLEWKTVDGASKRSAISVRYDTLGLRVKAPGDLTEDELDEALDALVRRTQFQESSALRQLETISGALQKFSMPSVRQSLVLSEDMIGKSDRLKDVIRNYFQEEVTADDGDSKQQTIPNESEIAGDVRSLICSYRDNNFTGRAVARIFHGIQSPNYPAYVWSRCRFWRSHLSCNFNAIYQIATREILALR